MLSAAVALGVQWAQRSETLYLTIDLQVMRCAIHLPCSHGSIDLGPPSIRLCAEHPCHCERGAAAATVCGKFISLCSTSPCRMHEGAARKEGVLLWWAQEAQDPKIELSNGEKGGNVSFSGSAQSHAAGAEGHQYALEVGRLVNSHLSGP